MGCSLVDLLAVNQVAISPIKNEFVKGEDETKSELGSSHSSHIPIMAFKSASQVLTKGIDQVTKFHSAEMLQGG